MTTPEQARELAEWSENNENLPAKVRDALLDLARQVEELQADAERYRHIKKMFRVFSLHIDGKHSYTPTGEFARMKGPSLDAAIDADKLAQ